MRRTIVVALGCAAVLLAPASALAGRSDSVDPAIMQPALNPAFAPWECWQSATSTTCHGAFEESWVNRPWEDVTCDGRLIYGTGGQERTLTRHGDAQGRARGASHTSRSAKCSTCGPTARARPCVASA